LARTEKTVEINASPEKVWEMLAFDRLLEWDEGTQKNARSVEYTSEVHTPKDKYKVGATAHVTEKRWEYDLEILESLKNEKIMFRSEGKYIYTMTYILKPVDGGTEFTLVGDIKMPYGILGEILYKLASRAAEKQVERTLEKLKNIVER